jgi:valyl-tRNA synthetase
MSIQSEPEQYDSKEAEPRLQKFWDKEEVYKFDEKGKANVYSIDSPPPYISGRPHMGHAYSYTLFDIIGRYKRMNGFNVLLPIGFDDNGQPTERYVEKKHNIKSSSMPRAQFIELCKKETLELEKDAKQDLIKLGLGFDWSLFYSTINPLSTKTAQLSFIDLHNKGLIYQGEEPTLWCPECQTALAQADVEDKERDTLLNYIDFKLENNKKIQIATTRPEFLPACVGIFVNPSDKRYKSLIGKNAIVPLFKQKVKILADEKVDAEFGTGIVMICTFGDKTDIEWWKKYKLPLKIILTKEGRLNDLAGKFKGQKLNEARKNIIEDLKSEKLLERQEKLHQTVGVCWRCGAAVEFLVSSQWRLILLKNKQKFLESARKIKWHPEFFLKRCEDWINNLNWDWVISRQRHYGVPMPVWYCKKCKKPLIADESQLPVDPQKVLPKKKCSCGSNSFIPSEDVFDTWFISSMTPEIVLQWVNKSKLFEKNFPEDLRPQGYEIIRTWAFYTIVKAAYHFNNIPWKNIIVHGMVLDPKGKAMHKSLGNAIEPVDLVNKFCADALRFWSCSAKIGEDLPIQEKELASGQKTITKLWNASKFAFMNLEGYKQEKLKSLEIMDRWIVSKLQGLIKKCEDGFENYDLFTPKTETENFFWHVFCDNYLEIIKKRIYEPSSKEEKISAQYTLYQSLLTILKLMAPIMPHITEELYQKYYRKNEKTKSIHISKWPEFDKKLVDEKIEKIGDKFIEILGKVRQIKTKNQKSLKAEIILAVEKDDLRILNPVLKDLKAVTSALEIKEGGFDVTFV